MGSSHPAAAGAHGRALRAAGAARRTVMGCAALIAVTGCIVGCTTASPGTNTQPTSQASSTSPSAKRSPPCPATPVAGPAHTLTFPQTIGSYQQADPPINSNALVFIGQNGCNNPEQSDDYQNSQGTFLVIQTGHHANLWHSFNAFWGAYFGAGGNKVTMVTAGPLGGSAGCGTDSEGATCNWFDNDTFGSLVANGMSEAQAASLMVTFRNAIEQPG